MQVLTNIVNLFLGSGVPIFVPIMVIIGSVMVGMKVKDAISSGITFGVVFTGMNLLISFMKDGITPATQAIMTSTRISLPVVDGRRNTVATISWAWPYVFLMFPLLVAVNVVIVLLNKTNAVNADLWNVWLEIFTAAAVASITHSVILAFMIAAVRIMLGFKSSDTRQHRTEKLARILGMSVTHAMLFFGAILYPVALVLRKIPGLNREFDTGMLKDRVDIFAGNHMMGFILGCLFGTLAKYSLAQILTTGIKAAAAMTLFPVVAKCFMQALSPISEAVSAFMNKESERKTLIVGLDQPVLSGYNEIWLTILRSIPFILIYSMVLPDNEILPLVGLMSTSLALLAFLVTGGNLFQISILCVIGAPVLLWVGTAFAPFIIELATTIGSIDLQAGELISNSLVNDSVFTYSISHLFVSLKGNFMSLIIFAVWLAGFILHYHDLMREAREDTTLEAKNTKAGQ